MPFHRFLCVRIEIESCLQVIDAQYITGRPSVVSEYITMLLHNFVVMLLHNVTVLESK